MNLSRIVKLHRRQTFARVPKCRIFSLKNASKDSNSMLERYSSGKALIFDCDCIKNVEIVLSFSATGMFCVCVCVFLVFLFLFSLRVYVINC